MGLIFIHREVFNPQFEGSFVFTVSIHRPNQTALSGTSGFQQNTHLKILFIKVSNVHSARPILAYSTHEQLLSREICPKVSQQWI